MKRIATLLLALIMCAGAFSAFGMSASAETAPDMSDRVIYQSNFDDPDFVFSTSNATTNGMLGFRVLNGYLNQPRMVERNGNRYLEVVSTNSRGDIDFMSIEKTLKEAEYTGDFVISINFKVINPNDADFSGDFFNVQTKTGSAGATWDTALKGLFRVNGNILYAKNGEAQVSSGINVKNNYATIECAFKKTGNKVTSVETYVNGNKLGTVDCADFDSIVLIRLFQTNTKSTTGTGQGVSISSVAMVKGADAFNVCDIDFGTYNNGVVASGTKFDGLKIWYDAASGKTHEIKNGRYEITSTNGNYMFDIRPYESDNGVKNITGTYSLSMKLGVIGDWSQPDGGGAVFCVRDNGATPNLWHKYFSLNSNRFGMVVNDAAKSKYSPVDLSVMSAELTWVFNYDYTNNVYTSITFYVNGENLGTKTLATPCIDPDQIRMFDYTPTTATKGLYIESIKIAKRSDCGYVAPTEKTDYIGYQTTAKGEDNKFDLRLLAVMNDKDITNYTKVGFKVKATYGDVEMNKTQDIYEVYGKIVATTGSGYTEYTAQNLAGSYVYALNCLNVPADKGEITFTVTTYYQMIDGDVVEEETTTFVVDPTKIPQKGVN